MAKMNLGNAEQVSAVSADANLFVEEGGSVRRAPLTIISSPFVEDEVAYGIRRNADDSSPTCTRIGNMDLHRTLPVQSLMRGCLLDDDGKVVEYLPDESWEGAATDGSKGQVMVEIPKHYRKCQLLDDGTMEVWLSLYPLTGYQEVSTMYVSAYEATVQRSTNKLASVKNEDADYRGGNNTADYDGTYQSQLGVPASSISLTNYRTYARNRGSAGKDGCGWNCYLYEVQKTLTWFFVVEYATLNSQATYSSELTSDGYHQGGLGSGVTTLNSTYWANFNSQRPFLKCGYTDSIGNRTGYVEYTMPEEYEASLTVQVPRYRGVENPFGHIYKWADGILVSVHPEEEDGGDGLSPVFVCKEPSKFSSTAFDDYTFVGNFIRVSSATYISRIMFGMDGDIIGCETGGSSSTYYCDTNNSNIAVTSNATRGVYFGGAASLGTVAGLFCASSHYAPSNTNAFIGSRLCFIPE